MPQSHLKGMLDNPRQEKFCRAYLRLGVGTDAAREAGYNGNNNTLQKTAYRLVRNPKIKARLKELSRKRLYNDEVNAAEVLKIGADIIRCDITRLFDVNGEVLQPHDIPEDIRHCIQSIKNVYDVQGNLKSREVKILDKNTQLNNFWRHFGLITADGGAEDAKTLVQELVKRAEDYAIESFKRAQRERKEIKKNGTEGSRCGEEVS